MQKFIFSQIIAFLIGFIPVHAIDATIQKTGFKVTAAVSDSVLTVGQKFILQFSVETRDKVTFNLPDIQGVKTVSGPQQSTSTSTNFSGGRSVTRTEQIFSYVMEAQSKGNTSIPAVVFKTDSTMSFSHPIALQISVASKVKKDKEKEQQSTVADDDVFVDVQCSSRQIAAQDSMLITYRIYSTYDLQDILDVQEPAFKGYKARKLPVNRMTRRQGWDVVNGRRYTTLNWYQYVIKAPAKQGEITLPQIKLKVTVRVAQANQNRDPFDPFGFFSTPTYRTEEKVITSQPKKVKVTAKGSSTDKHEWDSAPRQQQSRPKRQGNTKTDDSLLRQL